ncbi:MAG: ABC transporter ATP-binding protein, partial [Leptospira sp.]|nr:ABC transporter ATP-binding protein [Leptospira sp.]
MKIYKRIFQYAAKYKFRFISGILLSFLVSVFNGASLTSLIPIFDSIGTGENYKFQFSLTKRDKAILQKFTKKEPMSRIEEAELKLAETKTVLNQKFQKMKPEEIVFLFCSLVFPVYLLKLLCLAGTVYFINSTGYLAIRDIRSELYQKMQILPLNYFVKEKTGIIMSRVINDVDALAKVISSDLKDAINDFFYIVTHLLILFFLSWKMFLVVFI